MTNAADKRHAAVTHLVGLMLTTVQDENGKWMNVIHEDTVRWIIQNDKMLDNLVKLGRKDEWKNACEAWNDKLQDAVLGNWNMEHAILQGAIYCGLAAQ